MHDGDSDSRRHHVADHDRGLRLDSDFPADAEAPEKLIGAVTEQRARFHGYKLLCLEILGVDDFLFRQGVIGRCHANRVDPA